MASTIILCFVLTIMSILTINSLSSTKVAEQTSLNNVVDSSLKAMQLDETYNSNTYEKAVGDLLQLVILQSSNDGSINVKILEANTEEGLLDIEVSKTYKWFGIKKQVVCRRTVILDEFDNPPAKQVIVQYVYDEVDDGGNTSTVVHREETTFDGAIIKRPKNPKKQGYTFVGWSITKGNTEVVSNEEWQNFIVSDADNDGLLIFYAVFTKNS